MKTEKITVEESHLLQAIIWEGDLRIHTSREYGKKTPFKKNIIHGDTTAILSIQLLRRKLKKKLPLHEFNCRFLAPTYVGDQIYVEFQQLQDFLTFTTWNQDGVCVMEGEYRYAF